MGRQTITRGEVSVPVAAADGLQHALGFLGARAIPGVEAYADGEFTRTISTPDGPRLLSIRVEPDAVRCRVRPDGPGGEGTLRRLLDLDTDIGAVDTALARDPALAPLVTARPGLRSPGAVDGFEIAVRAVVGQQVSVAGARTVLGRIVARHGEPVLDGWRLFPRAAQLATARPDELPMPRARGRALVALAGAVAHGDLDLGADADRQQARRGLIRLPGIGPWTADYVCMRALGDPDVLLASDLGVRKAAAALGLSLTQGAQRWAPWRSYVTHHLWATLT